MEDIICPLSGSQMKNMGHSEKASTIDLNISFTLKIHSNSSFSFSVPSTEN